MRRGNYPDGKREEDSSLRKLGSFTLEYEIPFYRNEAGLLPCGTWELRGHTPKLRRKDMISSQRHPELFTLIG